MISIDTTLLKELASASSSATDAIDNAVEALNRVSTHNDWGCKEKYAINEYAITNRNKIKQLQENSRGFLSVITQVSNEFETSENSIVELFSSVEAWLSDVLSIATSVITNGVEHTGTTIDNHIGIASIFEEWKKINVYNIGDFDPFKNIREDYIPVSPNWDCLFKFEQIELTNLISPISVCNFGDINL